MKIAVATFLLVLAAIAPSPPAQATEPRIRTTQVADGLYMLKGRGGNIGVCIGVDGVLLIDDQFAPLAPAIEVAVNNIGGNRPRFIINTHHHGDHTGGNAYFGRLGTIIAHHNVRQRLLSAAATPAPAALPVITYGEGLTIHFNARKIQVRHLASGHTDGDSVVWFPDINAIHMGDHYFHDRFPYVDLAAGGSVDGLISNVSGVLAWLPEDAAVIPGHGALADAGDLRQWNKRLAQSVELIRRRAADGMTREQQVEAGLAGWQEWGQGFITTERWIDTVLVKP